MKGPGFGSAFTIASVDDLPRFLHIYCGYTHRQREALRAEPEAVPEHYQRELTAAAQRRTQARDRELWIVCRNRIQSELDLLLGGRRFTHVSSELRVISRQLEKIDRLLT
jgi:hypothetical protein